MVMFDVGLPSHLCPHCFQTQPARCHTPACYWIVLREKVLAQKKMEEAKLPKSRNNKYRRNTKKLLKMAHEFPLLWQCHGYGYALDINTAGNTSLIWGCTRRAISNVKYAVVWRTPNNSNTMASVNL